MEKVLELVFKGALGKNATLNVRDPKDGVTKADADKAMQAIIAANVIDSSAGDLASIKEARVRTTDVDILE